MSSAKEWYDTADSTNEIELSVANVCNDCISISREVVLGDDTAEGAVDVTTAVTQDSLGRWWVGQRGHLKVYEASGQLLKRVGRQGAGPLEFGKALPVYTDAVGNVHVLDPFNQRATVVKSDFSIFGESRLPVTDFFSAAAVDGGTQYVLSAWLPTERSIGLAVHVVEGDSILRSFDAPDDLGRVEPLQLHRLLAAGRDGRVFSSRRFSLDVVAYSSSGARIIAFSGPPLNSQPVNGPSHNLSDNPIPSEVLAIRADENERLWVLTRRVRENWRSFVVEVVRPDGTLGLEVKPGKHFAPDSIFSARLEVIDLNTRSIVASSNFAGPMDGFVGQHLMYQNILTNEGLPRIAVWRFADRVR